LVRAAKERELSEKIQDHTKNMKARRKKQTKVTPQEEMAAAMKELEIVSYHL